MPNNHHHADYKGLGIKLGYAPIPSYLMCFRSRLGFSPSYHSRVRNPTWPSVMKVDRSAEAEVWASVTGKRVSWGVVDKAGSRRAGDLSCNGLGVWRWHHCTHLHH